jgi:hypothetical protein
MWVLLLAASLLVPAPALAQSDRPTDDDIKRLIERINQERDRFEDQLDSELKRKVLRGPSGEVNVERYLDDLQDNVGKLKDRFKPDYAASAEALTVLRQGSDIHGYMSSQPPNLKGASEWGRLAASLGHLAVAYGTTFPLPEGAHARRLNDREVRQAADEVADSADRFKKELENALKRDPSVDQATREAAVREADQLKRDAKTLSSRLGDRKPASGEAKQLVERASRVQAAVAGRSLSPAAETAWGGLRSGLEKVAQSFGLGPLR